MAKNGKTEKTDKTDIDADLVRKLAALLDETGLTEIELGGPEGWKVRVAKQPAPLAASFATAPAAQAANPAAPAPAAVSAAQAAEADVAAHPGLVKSPMVGVAYTSSEPGAPPFVRVGDHVSEGQTLLLIEAMKVFNPIPAPRAGKVARILVANGAPVEYGEPLLVIE
jgi:acetyl-CoA carboxylase biotin carboxyl carrier protein